MNTGIGFTCTLPGRGFTIQTNVTPRSRTRAERRRRLAGIAVAQELPRCTLKLVPEPPGVVPAEVCFDARPCLEQRVLASLRSTISSHLWVTRRGQGKPRISPRQHRPRRRRKWSGRILIVQRGVIQREVGKTRSGHARAYVECKVYSWPQEHYRNLPRCAFWREPKAAKYERIVQDDTSAEFIPQSYCNHTPLSHEEEKNNIAQI
jgi:hypothetical protein